MNESVEIIKYRTVVNDAVCLSWEDMPEIQPPTLVGLVDFLKKCPDWDWTKIVLGTGFDKGLVDYGYRAQFKMPLAITRNDLIWFEKEVKEPMIRIQRRKILWRE